MLSVERTLNKTSDSVSEATCCFGMVVCVSLCVSACMCVLSPAVVIKDEEVSYSTPVQLLATANSHSIACKKREPGYILSSNTSSVNCQIVAEAFIYLNCRGYKACI